MLLFHRSATWRRRLGYLAPVGRMALTNYLTHSVLYFVLLTGVGFGLYGEVGPACVWSGPYHLRRANGAQPLVARALSLRSGGVGVANADIWSDAADAWAHTVSGRVAAAGCLVRSIRRRTPQLPVVGVNVSGPYDDA